ncbi:MAG: hypothetical protein NZM00_12255, partial [Anaerolinea sp.]|nr:hypothetical protein [Anaerolinea sp.]
MSHYQPPDLTAHADALLHILHEVIARPELARADLQRLTRQVARERRAPVFGQDDLIHAYRVFTADGTLPPFDPTIVERLRL